MNVHNLEGCIESSAATPNGAFVTIKGRDAIKALDFSIKRRFARNKPIKRAYNELVSEIDRQDRRYGTSFNNRIIRLHYEDVGIGDDFEERLQSALRRTDVSVLADAICDEAAYNSFLDSIEASTELPLIDASMLLAKFNLLEAIDEAENGRRAPMDFEEQEKAKQPAQEDGDSTDDEADGGDGAEEAVAESEGDVQEQEGASATDEGIGEEPTEADGEVPATDEQESAEPEQAIEEPTALAEETQYVEEQAGWQVPAPVETQQESQGDQMQGAFYQQQQYQQDYGYQQQQYMYHEPPYYQPEPAPAYPMSDPYMYPVPAYEPVYDPGYAYYHEAYAPGYEYVQAPAYPPYQPLPQPQPYYQQQQPSYGWQGTQQAQQAPFAEQPAQQQQVQQTSGTPIDQAPESKADDDEIVAGATDATATLEQDAAASLEMLIQSGEDVNDEADGGNDVAEDGADDAKWDEADLDDGFDGFDFGSNTDEDGDGEDAGDEPAATADRAEAVEDETPPAVEPTVPAIAPEPEAPKTTGSARKTMHVERRKSRREAPDPTIHLENLADSVKLNAEWTDTGFKAVASFTINIDKGLRAIASYVQRKVSPDDPLHKAYGELYAYISLHNKGLDQRTIIEERPVDPAKVTGSKDIDMDFPVTVSELFEMLISNLSLNLEVADSHDPMTLMESMAAKYMVEQLSVVRNGLA